MSDLDWQSCRELEAVLHGLSVCTTLTQCEEACNGGYNIVLKKTTEQMLDPDKGALRMLATKQVRGKKAQRMDVLCKDLETPIGKSAILRARIAVDAKMKSRGCTATTRDKLAAGAMCFGFDAS